MYVLGKKFLLAIKEKTSIGFTIHTQEKSISPKIFLYTRSTYIIKKLLMIGIIQKMTKQKLMMVSLLMWGILITQDQTTPFI